MKYLALLFFPIFLFASTMNKNGIVTKTSSYNVDKTIKMITKEAYKSGFTEFEIIDHQKNYFENYNKSIGEIKLILFKKYTTCSRLLDFDPSVGLDLPLRILVFKGKDEAVYIKYREPKYLKNIYNIKNLRETDVMSKKLDKITNLQVN